MEKYVYSFGKAWKTRYVTELIKIHSHSSNANFDVEICTNSNTNVTKN